MAPPKNEQVADQLRKKIRDGVLNPGDRVSSEPELAAEFNVSKLTVRLALTRLRNEGLINSVQGKGTFVRRQNPKRIRSNDRYRQEKIRAAVTGEEPPGVDAQTTAPPAEYAAVDADERLAAAFDVAVGTRLLRRRQTSWDATDDVPLSLGYWYIRWDLTRVDPEQLGSDADAWPATQRNLKTLGIEIAEVVEEIATRPPSPDEADELALAPGVSVFVIDSRTVDTAGRVVEVSEEVLPGDRHNLRFTTRL